MQRVDAPEILDSESCPANQVQPTLQTLDRINRWFGGVSTTQKMVERVATVTGMNELSLLEVAAGSGKMPQIVRQRLARKGITLSVTPLDRAPSHLPANHHCHTGHAAENGGIVADALALPFGDGAFDVVSCNLFAHHLNESELVLFVREGLRVSRQALLINDLVRHPLHLALVYVSFPIMGSRVAWLDGLTSVRRAYVPGEMRKMLGHDPALDGRIEISRNFLFRMGVIVWKREKDRV
jgi:ubiquinone/menaquinone biosynthesis C-methylase UbiE